LQGNTFADAATEEDLKIGFKYGFESVVEHQKILGQTPITTITQMQVNRMNKDI
jgi:hypothetical protein